MPILATYCAVCWIIAIYAYVIFYGSGAEKRSGSGYLTSLKTLSRNWAWTFWDSSIFTYYIASWGGGTYYYILASMI